MDNYVFIHGVSRAHEHLTLDKPSRMWVAVPTAMQNAVATSTGRTETRKARLLVQSRSHGQGGIVLLSPVPLHHLTTTINRLDMDQRVYANQTADEWEPQPVEGSAVIFQQDISETHRATAFRFCLYQNLFAAIAMSVDLSEQLESCISLVRFNIAIAVSLAQCFEKMDVFSCPYFAQYTLHGRTSLDALWAASASSSNS